MIAGRKLIGTFFFIVIISIASVALSQSQENPPLPTPEVITIVRASEEEANDAVGYVTVSAKIPEEDRCECGAVFEAKKTDSNEWVVLAVFSPEETGDEHSEYGWSYIANYLEIGKEYDIRVKIYDRQGTESEYGTKHFTMVPEADVPCSDGQFTNLSKEATASGENTIMLFAWDKVCKEEREATRYEVYKNGQEFRETDNGANNIAIAGEPRGDTWKIEAYGEEPPNNSQTTITSCNEIVPKLSNAARSAPRGFRTTVGVARVLQCETIGTWLRTIIEWEPLQAGSLREGEAVPPIWLSYSSSDSAPFPRINYVQGQIDRVGFPGYFVRNAFDQCAPEGYARNSADASYTDPWQQRGWTCNNSSSYQPPYSYTTFRNWVNFDLTSVGTSAWPVTTEFIY